MDKQIIEIFNRCLEKGFNQAIISNSKEPERIQKVKIRPVLIKNEKCFQVTEYCGQKVFHKNETKEEILIRLPEWFECLLKQAEIQTETETVCLLLSKKGKLTVKINENKPKELEGEMEFTAHNRKKHYILEEGKPIPFLIDLGVMSEDGKIIHSKYDKYRQINRFLEFIEDILPALEKEKEVRILDFGCGKSYLTFAMYYYLKMLKGYNIHITGLDLKDDVIHNCSKLKEKYGYEDLDFIVGDIASYEGTNHVDMVVTLHACDTATDYALFKAVNWGAKVIFSVPCCQHELNKQIQCEELFPILKFGLVKERVAALYTDALRADLLEIFGYHVQVMEFIDMEHTPKNILIRALKKSVITTKAMQKEKLLKYQECLEYLHANPKLYQLFLESEMIG